MAIIFSTERLHIRDYEPEKDAASSLEMYGDPEVMKYAGSRPGAVIESEDQMRERLEVHVQRGLRDNDGTGLWAIEDRASGEHLGTLILRRTPDEAGNLTEDVEIGWYLKKRHWGKGYATEAAKAGVVYGFEKLHLPRIISICYSGNTRSMDVMRRLGMTHHGVTSRYYGIEVEFFTLENPASSQQQSS